MQVASMVDPETERHERLWRAAQVRAQSRALRDQVARAAEAVARVEQEIARVHWILAGQGGPLADQAREHAERAEVVAAKEWAEAERLRTAPPDRTRPGQRSPSGRPGRTS